MSCTSWSTLLGQADTIRIYFATDAHILTPGHISELDNQLQQYDLDEITRIDILGYADYRGTEQYNLHLSDDRAQEVRKYLTQSRLVKDVEITLRAKGEQALPLMSDARRVDLIIHTRPKATEVLGTFEVQDIPIEELKSGSLIRIENLNFHPGRSLLLQSSIPHLKQLEKLLLENPVLKIEIQGHVCCPDKLIDHEDGYNNDTKKYDLSVARAKNIYDYLIKKGVEADRLNYRGFGWSTPLIYPEESEEDRIQNRRVELLVVEK